MVNGAVSTCLRRLPEFPFAEMAACEFGRISLEEALALTVLIVEKEG